MHAHVAFFLSRSKIYSYRANFSIYSGSLSNCQVLVRVGALFDRYFYNLGFISRTRSTPTSIVVQQLCGFIYFRKSDALKWIYCKNKLSLLFRLANCLSHKSVSNPLLILIILLDIKTRKAKPLHVIHLWGWMGFEHMLIIHLRDL